MSFVKIYICIVLLLELQNVNESDCANLTAIERDNDTGEFNFLITAGYRPKDKSQLKFIVSIRSNLESQFFGDNHMCAGVIISKRVILTTAHCLYLDKKKYKAANFRVVSGTPKRLQRVSTTQVIAVDKLIVHPDYIPRRFNDDIGIMKLKESINIDGSSADVISLADSSPVSGTKCSIMGWGSIMEYGPLPDEAVFGDMNIKPLSFCQNVAVFSPGMICAQNPNDSIVNSCQADSGGPLICNGKCVGIASFGFSCGGPSAVGIYADVYHFRDWILKNRASAKIPNWWLVSVCVVFFISNGKNACRRSP